MCPLDGPRTTCVHDGDTFWLDGEKIRIADIDAPELAGECAAERTLALRARGRLAQLLATGPIRLDRQGRDRYGRTLALVASGNIAIGPALVRERLARRWRGHRQPWCD